MTFPRWSAGLVMAACLFVASDAFAEAAKGENIALTLVTLDQLKGWALPEMDAVKTDGTFPLPSASGVPIKGRVGADGITISDLMSGVTTIKPGMRWEADVKFADNSTGHYAYVVEKKDDGFVLRSASGLQGTLGGKHFVLLDVNGNGRFDDSGVDVMVFEDKSTVKVGDPIQVGDDRVILKVSGKTLTSIKGVNFADFYSGGKSDPDGTLVTWNAIRAVLGVPPVKRDATLEGWGLKHIKYMEAVNTLVHPEDQKNPAYSAEGHKAGMGSCLSMGMKTAKDSYFSLMDTFFHRIPLIRPELETTGISFEGIFAAFDWANGPARQGVKYPGPLAFPPEGAFNVHSGWGGHEGPQPFPGDVPQGGVGETVTLTFPTHDKVIGGKITLTEGGKEVDAWTSAPDKPANAMFADNMNSLCLIGKVPLKGNTEYTVKVDATVNGQAFTKTWKFTTGEAYRGYGGMMPNGQGMKRPVGGGGGNGGGPKK